MTFDIPHSHPQLGVPEKVYPYRNEEGNTFAAIYRFTNPQTGKKEIRPYCLKRRDWVRPERPALYELDALAALPVDPVVLVEGEKCADALSKIGFLATTSMGGSSGAARSDWAAMKGRSVIIWPDNDEPGSKYARSAAEMCLKAGADNVSIVPISASSLQKALEAIEALGTDQVLLAASSGGSTFGTQGALSAPNTPQTAEKALITTAIDTLPRGWDVADAIQEGWQTDHIQALLDQSEPFESEKAQSTFGPLSTQAANDNWREPDMSFLEEEKAPPDFPLEIFPPELKEWVTQTATSKSAPADYVAGTLLTVSASLIGTSRQIVCWDSWSEPPILWTALVGSPSAGKSPAMDPVLSALARLEGDDLEDHAEALCIYETDKLEAELTKERWIKNVKSASEEGFATPIMPAGALLPEMPMRKRLIIADATPEALLAAVRGQPKGLLSSWDELAGWLSMDRYSAGKGGERAMWLHAYGGRPYTLDRVKNGVEPIHIPSLAVSVLGGIQPDRLQSCLLKGDDDGLSARFLYIYPNSAPRQRPLSMPNDKIFQRIVNRLNALAPDVDENQTPFARSIPLSADGAHLFLPWWQGLKDRCSDNPRMAGWWGKSQGLCLRLALVFEYIEWALSPDGMEPTEVSARSIENAINFLEAYAGPMAERAHGVACKSGNEANTRALALHVLDSGFSEFSVRDLQRRGPMRNLTAKEIKDACFDLVGYGWLVAAPVRQGATAGKSQGRFLVNPAL